jgi:DNA-binding transcriptional MerR regulator
VSSGLNSYGVPLDSMIRGNPDLLTIKALADQSKTHRQTIHYYLRRGVLPQPVRVSRTSALYPKSDVELLQLVKLAQEKHRLNLEEICDLFRETGYKPHVIRDRLKADETAGLSMDDLRLRLDPPPSREWIQDLIRRGLVEPEHSLQTRDIRFTQASAELVRGLWEGTRMGIPLESFQKINDRIRAEADRETAQFLASLREVELKGDAYPRVARLFGVLEKFATLRWKASLHRLFIMRFEQSFGRFLGENRQVIFPSETFFVRHGLTKEIDRLRALVSNHPADLDAKKQLGRAYQLRGDWTRLHDISREILRVDPGSTSAIGYLGHSLRYLGRFEESVKVLEDGIAKTNNPLLKVRLGQTLINQAADTGDASQFLGALIRRAKLAQEAMRESEHDDGLSRNVRGVLAVDSLMLSAPLEAEIPSLDDLERLYRDVHAASLQGLSVLSKISLLRARLFAAYALSVVRERLGIAGSQKLLDQVLKADPDAVLAKKAKKKQ